MAQKTKETLGAKDLTVLADRGYFSGEEILKCEQAQIKALVPKPMTSNSTSSGRFDKRDFQYEAKRDRYRCPAGKYATRRCTSIQHGMTIHRTGRPLARSALSAATARPISADASTAGSTKT